MHTSDWGDLCKDFKSGLTNHILPWRHIKNITLPLSQFNHIVGNITISDLTIYA